MPATGVGRPQIDTDDAHNRPDLSSSARAEKPLALRPHRGDLRYGRPDPDEPRGPIDGQRPGWKLTVEQRASSLSTEKRWLTRAGAVHVRTSAGPIQIGIPPETIKDVMELGLDVPAAYVAAAQSSSIARRGPLGRRVRVSRLFTASSPEAARAPPRRPRPRRRAPRARASSRSRLRPERPGRSRASSRDGYPGVASTELQEGERLLQDRPGQGDPDGRRPRRVRRRRWTASDRRARRIARRSAAA